MVAMVRTRVSVIRGGGLCAPGTRSSVRRLGVTASNPTNPNFNGHPYDFGPLRYNRKWQFKLVANYALPWGLHASGYLQSFSGRPWHPTISVLRLPEELNEPFMSSVKLEPRGNRTVDAFTQLDLRLQKDFRFGSTGRHRIELVFDAFNILNASSSTPSSESWTNDRGVYASVGSVFPITGEDAFGRPTALILPRQFRLGFRYVF